VKGIITSCDVLTATLRASRSVDAGDWEMHTRKDRWLRVILTWPVSKLARGVAPTVAMLAAWSVVVWNLKLKVTHNGLGFLATPIGLLLAFRVNSCVGRFHAARKAWGHMIYHARDLASTLAASDADAETKAYACRLLTAYAWCAKAFAASDAPEVVRPVLDTLLPAEAEGIAAARKPALAALSRLRKATMGLPFPSHVARSLHTSISELNLLYQAVRSAVPRRAPRRDLLGTAPSRRRCPRRSRRCTCATTSAAYSCGSSCCPAAWWAPGARRRPSSHYLLRASPT